MLCFHFRSLGYLALGLATLSLAGRASAQSSPTGHIDASTLVVAPHGTFGGIAYARYEAMFAGTASNDHAFRVPCQIIAPVQPALGSRLLLFDWLVASTIPTLAGQEQADARYTLTDAFLFRRGVSYATVRCDKAGIGTRSPVSNPVRPWSDGLLDTSTEFITSPGDEFDIVVAYVKALRTDPVALQLLGPIQRRAAFGYSQSGFRLRGLLRIPLGSGLFDFSLVGGTGSGYSLPTGDAIGFSDAETPPRADAGLEIDFQSETDVVVFDGHRARHEEWNYRLYQFAGAAHLRAVDAAEFGLADPTSANTADWVPFFRALFVAGNRWCNGIQPPRSLWLGAPNSAEIDRDAKGNALVKYVGGQPRNTIGYRLPEVAVGENQYIPLDPSFFDGSVLGQFRALAGSHVDLTDSFPSHGGYVARIVLHALALRQLGYLLHEDATEIIVQAIASDIGN